MNRLTRPAHPFGAAARESAPSSLFASEATQGGSLEVQMLCDLLQFLGSAPLLNTNAGVFRLVHGRMGWACLDGSSWGEGPSQRFGPSPRRETSNRSKQDFACDFPKFFIHILPNPSLLQWLDLHLWKFPVCGTEGLAAGHHLLQSASC